MRWPQIFPIGTMIPTRCGGFCSRSRRADICLWRSLCPWWLGTPQQRTRRPTRQAGGDRAGPRGHRHRLDADGSPSGVVHAAATARTGRSPAPSSSPSAPVLAAMLPPSARQRFWSAYADHRLSISVFSATFGLSVRPATLGFRSYSTFLLPRWMKTPSDHRRSADLLTEAPGSEPPLMTVVDYSAIESGL